MSELRENRENDTHEVIYNEILIPFSEELLLRDKIREIKRPVTPVNPSDRDKYVKIIQAWLNEKYFKGPGPPVEKLEELSKNCFFYFDILFKIVINLDKKLNTETRSLFLHLFIRRCTINLLFMTDITEIDLDIEYSKKIIDVLGKFHVFSDTARNRHFMIIRCLSLASHQALFVPEKSFCNYCLDLVSKEIKLAKRFSFDDYLNSLKNYLTISLDHLYFNSNIPSSYINVDDFNKIRDMFVEALQTYLKDNEFEILDLYFLYESLLVFYRIRVCNLISGIRNKQAVTGELTGEVIILSEELIKAFYGEKCDYLLFFTNSRLNIYEGYNGANPYLKYLKQNYIQNLSGRLSRLLNDTGQDVTGVLFAITRILGIFKKFTKININIFKRILILSNHYYNRKIYLIANILYQKNLFAPDIFEKNIIKIRENIEQHPIRSIINYFNREISKHSGLSQKTRNALKIDNFIATIQLKQFDIQRQILITTDEMKRKGILNDHNKSCLGFFRNEHKNIFLLATNIHLIQELSKVYCLFIDSYIRNERMEYREDFIQKATAIKMQVLDINPYNFTIALMYSKVGKLKLYLGNDPSIYYSLKKDKLTDIEKAKLAGYIKYTLDYLPEEEEGVNRMAVKELITHLRDPAISNDKVAYPESRILKVISAILNKVTRQDCKSHTLFPQLYKESFVAAKKVWDLDPLIIFYFNRYFNSKGYLSFFGEISGKKITMAFDVLLNENVKARINTFIKNLVINTPTTDLDVNSQLEELSRLNEVKLVEDSGRRKRISMNQIKKYIKDEIAISFETSYVEPDDIQYLNKLLEFFFVAIAKQSFTVGIKYVLTELIKIANRANLKKAHFKHLDQDMTTRYRLGIKNYAEKVVEHFSDYKSIAKEEGLKIKIVMQVFKNKLIITVHNNYQLHPNEADDIHNQIILAAGIKNLDKPVTQQAFGFGAAGSGFVVMVLLLRKFGLYNNFFRVNLKNDETVYSVTIPLSLVTEEERDVIATELSKEIDKVPAIQSHIQDLRAALHNPASTIEGIRKIMQRDPSLIVDVLKRSNSAYFPKKHPVKTITEAIKVLGMKRLQNIVMASNSFRLLKGSVSEKRIEAIIHHCELTAMYSREIIRIKEVKGVDEDDLFLAALLHDVGIIIVEGLHPDIYQRIQNTLENKDIPIEVIENLASGINHSLVGYKIMEKWNFPEFLSEIIRYHHNPVDAPRFMDEVFIIYLADIFTHYNEGNFLYENIDSNVLTFFDLNTEQEVKLLGMQLKANMGK